MTRDEAIGVLSLMREQAYEKAEGGAVAECALRMAIDALQKLPVQPKGSVDAPAGSSTTCNS